MKRKDTHTLQQVETYCYELVGRIQEAETIEEKKALHKKLKPAERFVNDINTKETNGKQYPDRFDTILKDDKPMNKEEIFKLIDSVTDLDCIDGIMTEGAKNWKRDCMINSTEINLAGIFPPFKRE